MSAALLNLYCTKYCRPTMHTILLTKFQPSLSRHSEFLETQILSKSCSSNLKATDEHVTDRAYEPHQREIRDLRSLCCPNYTKKRLMDKTTLIMFPLQCDSNLLEKKVQNPVGITYTNWPY